MKNSYSDNARNEIIGIVMFLIVLLVILLTSCEKQEKEDFRDQYVGEYYGTYYIGYTDSSWYETRNCYAEVVKGYESTEVVIASLNSPQFNSATLNWGNFKYNTFKWSTSNCGNTLEEVFAGTGKFVSDSLLESFTFIEKINGKEYRRGVAFTKLKKTP